MFKNIFFTLLMVLIFHYHAHSAILLDKVMAVVNKDVITWSEVYAGMQHEFAETLKHFRDVDKQKFLQQYESAYLDTLIDKRLIIQEAEKMDIKVSDAEIDDTIKDIRQKYNLKDDKDFEVMLKMEGYTPKQYRKNLYEQIVSNRIIDREIRGRIIVSEQDIEKYITDKKLTIDNSEGYAISQIFIKHSNEANMHSKLTEIYNRLKAGEPFAMLAEMFSDDPVSAKHGGNLGFIKKTDLSQEILTVLQRMKKGEISEPIKTSVGVMIIRLDGLTIFANDVEFKDSIKTKIFEERFTKNMQKWLKELREKSYIEIKL